MSNNRNHHSMNYAKKHHSNHQSSIPKEIVTPLYQRHANKILSQQQQQRNICTESDYLELKKAYRFIMSPSSTTKLPATWQERMAKAYHDRLFKEYAIADLTRYKTGSVGLRWRTEREVVEGRGHFTCGNKHCPSDDTTNDRSGSNAMIINEYYKNHPKSEDDEKRNLCRIPYGLGLHSYEVNFAYVEDGEKKNELVKLRLCLRCAPLLFYTKGGVMGARRSREKKYEDEETARSIDEEEEKKKTRLGSKNKERKTSKRRKSIDEYSSTSEAYDSLSSSSSSDDDDEDGDSTGRGEKKKSKSKIRRKRRKYRRKEKRREIKKSKAKRHKTDDRSDDLDATEEEAIAAEKLLLSRLLP